jgi:type IV pilus assembly protein PilY1
MAIGLIAFMACAAVSMADDTELLLVNPAATARSTPNVLMIIDSSGSMRSTEQTREIYDPARRYTGGQDACDEDYYYWTRYENVTPACDKANTQRLRKEAFVCLSGRNQLRNIGIYRTMMAQYRGDPEVDGSRWQTLAAGNESNLVECARDSGTHGDGSDTGAVYAQRGGSLQPFTRAASEEVAWGSWPTSQSVSLYDGNYLNYLRNPRIGSESRIDIVASTVKSILSSIDGINVGIMRFNNNAGGTVLQAVKDLDRNRDELIATIDGIVADGFTPASETMLEAARYWRGLPAYYGDRIGEHDTDTAGLRSLDPEVYRSPSVDACTRNFNVLLTDGKPSADTDPVGLVGALPDWTETLGYAGCTGAGDGACLDDIAAYLANGDIARSVEGTQSVITHAIGFVEDLPILEATARRGGGDYFLAGDVPSLTLALLEIVNKVQDRSLSFAAPAVAVNAFNRTRNLNDLYMTTFAASEKYRWPGNLKKYRIDGGIIVDRNGLPAIDPDTGLFADSARSFWSGVSDGNDVTLGGAVENLPGPDDRRLYTNNTRNADLTSATNALSVTNIDAYTPADFGLTGARGEPDIESLIRWARGEDVLDEDLNPATNARKHMGDALHAQPAAVVYGGNTSNTEAVVFAATNDGYLHAIDANTGRELWAFVPKELLPKLPDLYSNPDSSFKNYGIDGNIVPVVADRDDDGRIEPADGDFVFIVFGMRRGGSAYYALDVTDRNSPRLKWRADHRMFGQSWSTPVIARVDMADTALNDDKAVVIVGGGYDTAHDTSAHPARPDAQGAGVYMLDLQSGEILWRAGADNRANLRVPGMTRAIPAAVQAIDLTGDGFVDRLYASDMGGQVLRFDVFSGRSPNGFGDEALVSGGVIAQLGAEGQDPGSISENRRFYTSPDVSIFKDNLQNRQFVAISIGSGYRAHPLDNSTSDRFYSIRDANVFNKLSQSQYDALTPVSDAELVEVAGSVGKAIGANKRGWKLTLPADQKVLSSSSTFDNEIFFVAFSPDVAGTAACSAGTGRNFLYRVAVANGDPIAERDTIVVGEEDQARFEPLTQGGIAPAPRFIFPSPSADCVGEDCNVQPIVCLGIECFDPGFENSPVRTLWTQGGIE